MFCRSCQPHPFIPLSHENTGRGENCYVTTPILGEAPGTPPYPRPSIAGEVNPRMLNYYAYWPATSCLRPLW